MSKIVIGILYAATILTLLAPTVGLVRNTIIPGVEQLHAALQEAVR